jgi:S-adenosylmethionine uptake transporter
LRLSPILLVCIGVFCGSAVDALVKHVTKTTPVITTTSWRFIIASIIMLAIFLALKRPVPPLSAVRFHAMRSAAQAVSAFAFFYGLTQLALAEAVVLGFTGALMIAPIARIILGEKISPLVLGATCLGFCGAAFAMTGETGGAPPDGNRLYGIIAVVISALGYALCLVLLRLRAQAEDSATIMTFLNLFPALFLLPFLVMNQPLPAASDWPQLILLALFGIGIWWMLTLAYARAPAQRLAPFEYTALIYSTAFGIIFFGENPGWQLFTGAAIIITACLIVAWDAHRSQKQEPLPRSDIVK